MVLKIIRCRNEKLNKCPVEYTQKVGAGRLPVCQCGGERTYSVKWYVRLQVEGKSYFRAVSSKKDDAIRHEAEILDHRRVGLGSRVITKQLTIKEAFEGLFDKYCEDMIADRRLADVSAIAYKSCLTQHVVPMIGHIKLQHLDHITINEYTTARRKQTSRRGGAPAAATINHDIVALKVLIKAAINARFLDRDPIAGVEKLPEPTGTRDRVLTDSEIATLLHACEYGSHTAKAPPPPYLVVMVLVALNTGLRREGVMGLRWEHINWEKNVISRSVKHVRKNGDKVVVIPMSSVLRQSLLAWRERDKATRITGLVFPSPATGKAFPSNAHIGWRTAVEVAGLGTFCFHQLRHTFITRFIQAGNSIALTGNIVGHSSSHMTGKYTHLQEEFKQEAMKGFNLGGKL